MIIGFTSDIARGLKYMHEKGFAHCDIKTSNALVEYRNEIGRHSAALTDFGIAKVLDETNKKVVALQTTTVKGATVAYAAPEILTALNCPIFIENTPAVTKAGDVYALACVIFELLTRKSPWK